MSILTHIIAAMGGGFVGIAVMALCFAASKADEAEERMLPRRTSSIVGFWRMTNDTE